MFLFMSVMKNYTENQELHHPWKGISPIWATYCDTKSKIVSEKFNWLYTIG
jgi:hypothetical protein